MTKLKFIRKFKGCYNKIYNIDEVIEYQPWCFEWKGQSEYERISKGIYIRCYGQGEFDKLIAGRDVEVIHE